MTLSEIKTLALQLHDAIVDSEEAVPDARTANVLAARAHEILVMLHGYEAAPTPKQRPFVVRAGAR